MATTAISSEAFAERLAAQSGVLSTSTPSQRFTYADFTDLNHPLRLHLSPLSQIAHIDVNAFYAQVEQVRLGYTDQDPIVCVQWGSLIAVSYAARKYGISRMDSLAVARVKCPHVIGAHTAVYKKGESDWSYAHEAGAMGVNAPLPSMAHHKVSLDPYRRESRKMMRIFKAMCGSVEKASVDEVYLDLGRLVYAKALLLFPQLAGANDNPTASLPPIPDTLPVGLEWEGFVVPSLQEEEVLSIIVPSSKAPLQVSTPQEPRCEAFIEAPRGESPPIEEQAANANTPHLCAPTITSWCDIFRIIASQITLEIRTAIHHELGYTTSCGIAATRTIAKLASAHRKPNDQTIVREGAPLYRFLDMYQILDVTGFGGKTGKAVSRALGDPLNQILSLTYAREQYPVVEAVRKRLSLLGLGDLAPKVYAVARGDLRVPVPAVTTISTTTVQTFLSSKNFRNPCQVHKPLDMEDWMLVFVADIVNRIGELDEELTTAADMVLGDQHQQASWLRPTRVTLLFTCAGLKSSISRQTTIGRILPLEELKGVLFAKGMDLLKQLEAQWNSLATGVPMWPCINMGLSAGGFKSGERDGVRSIDGFLRRTAEPDFAPPQSPGPVDTCDAQLVKPTPPFKPAPSGDILKSLQNQRRSPAPQPDERATQFTDPRPSRVNRWPVRLPPPKGGTALVERYCPQCDCEVEEPMAEHQDYHFALALSREMETEPAPPSTTSIRTFPAPQSSTKRRKSTRKAERGQSQLPF